MIVTCVSLKASLVISTFYGQIVSIMERTDNVGVVANVSHFYIEHPHMDKNKSA